MGLGGGGGGGGVILGALACEPVLYGLVRLGCGGSVSLGISV